MRGIIALLAASRNLRTAYAACTHGVYKPVVAPMPSAQLLHRRATYHGRKILRDMPMIGLGTCCQPSGDARINATLEFFAQGGRLLDTAQLYENSHADLGEAIRRSGLPREKLWVSSKATFAHDRATMVHAVDHSLQQLGLSYIDLMLIHSPKGGDGLVLLDRLEQMWLGLIDSHLAGKVVSIGVSNFYAEQIEHLHNRTGVLPAANQVEYHPWSAPAMREIVQWCQERGLAVTAYGSLGGAFTHSAGHASAAATVARRHGVSASQVLLRWALDESVAVIPGATSPAHVRDNAHVAPIDLSCEDVEQIATSPPPKQFRSVARSNMGAQPVSEDARDEQVRQLLRSLRRPSGPASGSPSIEACIEGLSKAIAEAAADWNDVCVGHEERQRIKVRILGPWLAPLVDTRGFPDGVAAAFVCAVYTAPTPQREPFYEAMCPRVRRCDPAAGSRESQAVGEGDWLVAAPDQLRLQNGAPDDHPLFALRCADCQKLEARFGPPPFLSQRPAGAADDGAADDSKTWEALPGARRRSGRYGPPAFFDLHPFGVWLQEHSRKRGNATLAMEALLNFSCIHSHLHSALHGFTYHQLHLDQLEAELTDDKRSYHQLASRCPAPCTSRFIFFRWAACYHGVGHGMYVRHHYEYERALLACWRLVPPDVGGAYNPHTCAHALDGTTDGHGVESLSVMTDPAGSCATGVFHMHGLVMPVGERGALTNRNDANGGAAMWTRASEAERQALKIALLYKLCPHCNTGVNVPLGVGEGAARVEAIRLGICPLLGVMSAAVSDW